jgi:NADH-quinone oxidoreductase subunit J
MQLFVFICAAAMILAGAVGVIVRSHPVHAALSLILTLFGVSVMYVSQEAQFLAAVQVIVYAGAIVVLFLFVIMLLGIDRTMDLQVEPIPLQRPLALVMGVGLVGLLGAAIVRARDSLAINPGTGLAVAGDNAGHDANIQQLATSLYGDHVFALELASVLLIVAVTGTVLVTRRWPKSDGETS